MSRQIADEGGFLRNQLSQFRDTEGTWGNQLHGGDEMDDGIADGLVYDIVTPFDDIWTHYRTTLELDNLNALIAVIQQTLFQHSEATMIPSASDTKSSKPHMSLLLGVALRERYKHTGLIENLDASIDILQRELEKSADLSSFARALSLELGCALRTRFVHSGNVNDLHEAMRHHQQLANDQDSNLVTRSTIHAEVATTFFAHFTEFGVPESLSRARELLDQATENLLEGSPVRQEAELVLAHVIFTQYRMSGDIMQLHTAAAISQHVLKTRNPRHPELWMAHNRLANSFLLIWLRTKYDAHRDDAIGHARVAFHLLHPENPNCIHPAIPLASMLIGRFEILGERKDLDECGAILQGCRDFSHRDQPKIISRLAAMLGLRFRLLGASRDLDDAIALQRSALRAEPPDAPFKVARIGTLVSLLTNRHSYRRDLADLEEAEDLLRDCLTRSGHVFDQRNSIMLQLAALLIQDEAESVNREKLGEGIALCEQWQSLPSNRDKVREDFLCLLLGRGKIVQFDLLHSSEDLRHGIDWLRKALTLRPQGHVARPGVLVYLSGALHRLFGIDHNVADVIEAKELLLESLDCLSANHPERATMLFRLGHLHLTLGAPFFSISVALDYSKTAVTYPYQSAEVRLKDLLDFLQSYKDTLRLGKLGHLGMGQSLFSVYSATTELLPQVAYLGLDPASRLRVLETSKQLATDGALFALQMQNLDAAIEMLEQGRTVFWSQHLRLRSAFDDLPHELAEALTTAAAALEHGTRRSALAANEGLDASQRIAEEDMLVKRRRLSDEFELLVQQARALPGHMHFMRPDPFEKLHMVAQWGPVVVLLVENQTCHAVVMADHAKACHIPLPGINMQRLESLAAEARQVTESGRHKVRSRAMLQSSGKSSGAHVLEGVLEILWVSMFKPIVAYLIAQVCQSHFMLANLRSHAMHHDRRMGQLTPVAESSYVQPERSPIFLCMLPEFIDAHLQAHRPFPTLGLFRIRQR